MQKKSKGEADFAGQDDVGLADVMTGEQWVLLGVCMDEMKMENEWIRWRRRGSNLIRGRKKRRRRGRRRWRRRYSIQEEEKKDLYILKLKKVTLDRPVLLSVTFQQDHFFLQLQSQPFFLCFSALIWSGLVFSFLSLSPPPANQTRQPANRADWRAWSKAASEP